MEKITKIVLAILLLLCLLDMPYGFYQMVRFIAFMGFGFLAFTAKQKQQEPDWFIYGTLALLFQPFLKISLGRELWFIVDLIVGLGLLASMFLNRGQKKRIT